MFPSRLYKFSTEDIKKILDLRKKEHLGLSIIAERYSCSAQRIAKVLHDNGMPIEKVGKKESVW